MFKIEKLGDDNYHVWKQKVELLLAFKELDDHITEPERPIDTDNWSEWKKKDAKAKAIIGLTLSDDHLDHVRGAETALEMWNSVVNIFQRRTLLNKLKARRNFYSAQMLDGEKVLTYINRVRQLASDLKSMDVEVEDEDIAMSVLCGLPGKFEHLIVAIDTVADNSKLSLDFVKSRLLQEEQRMDERTPVNKSNSALMTSRKTNRYCTYCKRNNHTEQYCFKKEKDERLARKTSSSGLVSKGVQNHGDDNESDSSGDYVCLMSNTSRVERASSHYWYIDSGATSHMTFDRELFTEFKSVNAYDVGMGNASSVKAVGKGTVSLNINVKSKVKECQLKNVAYVPDLKYNLLSVSHMENLGMKIEFSNGFCNIMRGNKVIAQGIRKDGLYLLDTFVNESSSSLSYPSGSKASKPSAFLSDLKLWHARLAHVHTDGIKSMVKNKVVDGIHASLKQDVGICESCVYGKSSRAAIPKQGGDRSKHVLDLVHSDVMGPMQVQSLGGSRYFITFIDDHSRYCTVYPMKRKSQALDCFKQWLAMVERQKGTKLKAIRCDNGGEYISNEFDSFLAERGITRNPTIPYNPHQNGVAERINRTFAELMRSMLHHKNMPKHFWAESLNVAAYIRNRVTSRGLPSNTTPFEIWHGRKPNLGHLRVFGSKCWYNIRTNEAKKLDSRAREAILIGYAQRTRGYKLWDVSKQKVVVSRDVKFDETGSSDTDITEDDDIHDTTVDIAMKDEQSEQNKDIDTPLQSSQQDYPEVNIDENVEVEEHTLDTHESAPLQHVSVESDGRTFGSTGPLEALRRSTRFRRPPGQWWKQSALLSNALPPDPTSYKKAISSSDADHWQKAMQSEFDSLMEHKTWVLEPRPPNQNVVSCRWVYVTKDEATPDGNTRIRHKARLVARGFTQVEGVDYTETFAPVVKFMSVRILLAIATKLGLHLHQMDVVTAFLNGDLDETVYMEQPEGFKTKGKENHVCRLVKALYGLKQASRQWYKKMDEFLTCSLGLCRNIADECLYTGSSAGALVIIALYVDDLLIACSDQEKLLEIKAELSKRFRMKDLNEARQCLGFEIHRDVQRGTLHLSQTKYANKVLCRFGMEQSKGVTTPMETGIDLNEKSEPALDIPYRQAIGSLMYLMVGTRPDIAFGISKLAKFVESPTLIHWNCVKRVLRYIKSTSARGICFDSKKDLEPLGFVDSDYAGDVTTRKSTSGYLFTMVGGAVSWCSRQQEVVALSSTEAEYISLCSGLKEAIWLKRLVSNLKLPAPIGKGPLTIMVDNQGAIDLAKNGSVNRRTKHIDVRFHFCRQAVEDKLVSLKYCPTNVMGADVLTKPLGRLKLEELLTLFGLGPRSM